MDLRAYFQKLSETEQSIVPESVVVVSNNTPDGGKAGIFVEVGREVAARMIVSGSARLASEAESEEFRDQVVRDAEEARAALEASKVRLMFAPFAPAGSERPMRPPVKTKG